MPRAPPGPLRLTLETELRSLDPADAGDVTSRRIVSQIFDPLLEWAPSATDDDAPDILAPRILKDHPRVSDDGLTWTLELRTDDQARRFAADTCLKGQARTIRASDVAASLLRITPGRHAAYALLAGRIVGLDAHHAGSDARPGIVADDERHIVTLQLTRPQPELPALLANPMLAIVPPECVAYYDGSDAAHPPFARHPVGSGDYVLDHARSELPRTVTLVENLDAPARPGPPGCPRVPCESPVVFSHFADPEPALRSFQAGELAAIVPGQAQFAEVVADPASGALVPNAAPPGTRLRRFPTLSTTLLVFRMRDPDIGQHSDPVVDARHRALRQAVALAFDAIRYHRVIRNDAWAVQRARVVPRTLGGDLDDVALHRFAPPAADLEQASRILAAAGVSGPRTLRYWTETGEGERQEAAILRDALRPLDITLEVTHRTHYLHAVLGGTSDAQLFSLRYDADYHDAASFLAPFTCAAPDNYSGFCDPAYDAAYAAFAVIPTGPARDAAAAQLERMLGEAVPVRPIDQPESWYLTQPWLRGVTRHPVAGLRVELLTARR